jgi:hypothetical protein
VKTKKQSTNTTPHLYHFLCESDGGRHGLGVVAQNEAKVDVKELPVVGDENVVQVPVAHSEKVGENGISRARANVIVHRVGVARLMPVVVHQKHAETKK